MNNCILSAQLVILLVIPRDPFSRASPPDDHMQQSIQLLAELPPEAVHRFKQGVQLQPVPSYMQLGLVAASEGTSSGMLLAVQAYQQAVLIQPTHEDAILELGQLLNKQNRLKEAVLLHCLPQVYMYFPGS